jgi:hypothetical protein
VPLTSRNRGSPLWDPGSWLQPGGAWGNSRDIDRADDYVLPSGPSLFLYTVEKWCNGQESPGIRVGVGRSRGGSVILHQLRRVLATNVERSNLIGARHDMGERKQADNDAGWDGALILK